MVIAEQNVSRDTFVDCHPLCEVCCRWCSVGGAATGSAGAGAGNVAVLVVGCWYMVHLVAGGSDMC